MDLTTTSSDLNDEERWETEYSMDGNKFYHVLTQDERREIEAAKRRAARFVMRLKFRICCCVLVMRCCCVLVMGRRLSITHTLITVQIAFQFRHAYVICRVIFRIILDSSLYLEFLILLKIGELFRNKVLTKRTIDHPNFQNISMVEAVQSLLERPKGEAIFRPSTKSTDFICLSLKVYHSQLHSLAVRRIHLYSFVCWVLIDTSSYH